MKTKKTIMIVILFFAFALTIKAQWVQVNGPLQGNSSLCFAFNGSNVYAGTRGGVFLSADNGLTWNGINTGLTNLNIRAITLMGNDIIAGTEGGGAFKSTDNGASWSAVNSGLGDTMVLALITKDTKIFAGTAKGVYVSSNNGSSWIADTSGMGSAGIVTMATLGNYIFAGGVSTVFYSHNNGASWIPTIIPIYNVSSLTTSGSKVFCGAYHIYTSGSAGGLIN